MPTKLGYNIEGNDLSNRRDLIINELKSYTANWHLCLGDEALAIDLLKHTAKGVIYRVFDPFNEYRGGQNTTFDAEIWQQHTPQELVNYVKTHMSHLLQYQNMVFSIGNNEPSTRGKTTAFLNWCIQLADLGFQNGIRFAIAEIASAKTIDHNEVKGGVWDNFISTMNAYRGFHIVTFHEYTTGILPATFLPDYPLNLDNTDTLDKSNWSNATMNLSSIDGNWHLGRGALITHVRAKQLGLQPIPFVITECAFDWMDDIVSTPERAETLAHLQNRFKVPNYDFMRGSTGHRAYHEWLMQESGYTGTWNEYLFAQYKWLVSAYPDECEGFTIFALNHDWDYLRGHDMSKERNDQFRQLVIADKESTPMPDPIVFDPPLYDAKVSVSNGYLNLRANMSASSTDLGDITTTPIEMKVSKQTNEVNGLQWYKFKQTLPTGDIVGYFADVDKLRIEYVEDVPDETEPPTPEQWQALIDEISEVKQKFAALEQDVANMKSQFELIHVDIPIPNFTLSLPRFMVPYVVTKHRGNAGLEEAIAQRTESGTPTLSQIANEIYSTATVEPSLNTHTNVSDLGSDMILDEMMNPSAEDDSAA